MQSNKHVLPTLVEEGMKDARATSAVAFLQTSVSTRLSVMGCPVIEREIKVDDVAVLDQSPLHSSFTLKRSCAD